MISEHLIGWLFSHSEDYEHLPFMERYWLIKPRKWLPFKVGLHYTYKSDPIPYLHDHPWDWCSILLRGRYVEISKGKDGKNRKKEYGPWSIRFHRAEFSHKLSLATGLYSEEMVRRGLSPGVWTIFFMGPKRREWGFWIKRKWIQAEEFYSMKGRRE